MTIFIRKIFSQKKLIFIIFLFFIFLGYYFYNFLFIKRDNVVYVTAPVERGTIVSSVNGSGQISASEQIEIKSKVSGDVVFVGVKNGQDVKTGTLLVQIDDADAHKAVEEARINLENAKLSLEKLKLDKEIRLNTPVKGYEEGMDILSDFYGKFPSIMEDLKNVYFGTGLSLNKSSNCSVEYSLLNDCNITYYSSYGDNKQKFALVPGEVLKLYYEVNELYEKGKFHYQKVKRSVDNEERLSAIKEGREIALKLGDIIKIGRDVINSFRDILVKNGGVFEKQALVDEHINILSDHSSTVSNYASSLFSSIDSVNSYINSLQNLDLDIKNQGLIIKQRENSFLDTQKKLEDYSIRAPFDGIVSKIEVKKGDSISAGTIVSTLISKNKIAEVSLNEVDASKVAVGQKANLTFDAIDGLIVTGKVIDIDLVGTVTQGVVSYNIKIAFDSQDDRIKPGMSVSASIITNVKQDVILVPNSAIKFNNSNNYVELLKEKKPYSQVVEIGISNDTMTEIISGLSEGDQVIVQTISKNSSSSGSGQQNSSFRIPGFTTGSGGFRFQNR
jgi:HlyD family secretion protein